MRITRVLCALFVVFSCIPIAATAQRDRAIATPGNPAFLPAAPGPLSLPVLPTMTKVTRHVRRNAAVPQKLRPLLPEEQLQLRLTQQPRPDDGFKPISELPPEDKLPAAPMLVGAYAFVMLALFAYVVSLSRRLNAVSREIGKLDAQLKQR